MSAEIRRRRGLGTGTSKKESQIAASLVRLGRHAYAVARCPRYHQDFSTLGRRWAANPIGLGCPGGVDGGASLGEAGLHGQTKPLRRSHEKRVLSDSNGGASLADYVALAP